MNLRTIPHDRITRLQAAQARLSGALWAARTLTPGAQEYVTQSYGDPRPAWTDVSYWQGVVNMGILKTAGFHEVFVRAGISWGYKDPRAAQNIANAQAAGLYWSTYHVLYPGQSVVDQADKIWYKVQPELDKVRPVPRVIDLEVSLNQSAGRIAADTRAMSDLVLSRDGLRPIIYSRKSLMDKWLASWSTAELNEHYYWLAQYLWDRTKEHPGPPTLPQRVADERVILHQTADKKPPPVGAVDSLGFDWDRWVLGDAAQMDKWIVDEWGPVAPPLTLEQRVERLEGFHGI